MRTRKAAAPPPAHSPLRVALSGLLGILYRAPAPPKLAVATGRCGPFTIVKRGGSANGGVRKAPALPEA